MVESRIFKFHFENKFDMIGIKVLLFCLMISSYECFFGKQDETNEEILTRGMVDDMAELAHFTGTHFGYVDYRSSNPFNIEKFRNLEADHEIKLEEWTPEFWQYMVEEISDMKTRYCENTLKDPVLLENDITFDEEADETSFKLDAKEVVFFRYKIMPIMNHLVQCPIKVQGKEGYSAYITSFERTEQEGNQDFYFILLDLYYESIHKPTNQVVVAMRTKLGATVPLLQRMKEFLRNSFNSAKYKLAYGI